MLRFGIVCALAGLGMACVSGPREGGPDGGTIVGADAAVPPADGGADGGPGPCVGPVRRVTTVHAFGAPAVERSAPPLEGFAERLGDDRILFGDPLGSRLALSLVQVGDAGLATLDQRVLDVYVERWFGSWDWTDRLTTFLVPLSDDRVVLVATRQRLALLGLEGDRIESLAELPLGPGGSSLYAGAGRGDRLWACGGLGVYAFRVTDEPAIVSDPSEAFALPAVCSALTLDPAGETLWAATAAGLVPIDVRDPTAPVVGKAVLSATRFYRMAFAGDLVVAHELLRYGELGSVFVFRRADLTTASPGPVATFAPAEGAGLWARPVGFAALDGALLVEWFRVEGGTRTYTIERHAMEAGGVSASLGRLPVRAGDELGLLLSPVALSAAGRYAVGAPYPRVVALEGDSGLAFRTGPRHGALERAIALPGDTWLAVGPFGSLGIDGLGAGAPATVHGGVHLGADTPRLRIAPALPGSGEGALLTLPSDRANVRQEGETATVGCLGFRDGRVEPAGTVTLAGGPAALGAAGGALFQLAEAGPSTLRLARTPIPSRCTGRRLAPTSSRLFALDATADAPRLDVALALDAHGADALVGAVYGDGLEFRVELAWGAWSGDEAPATGELPATTDRVDAIALARGRGLVLENRRRLHVLVRSGATIAVERTIELADGEPPRSADRILAFDGRIVHLAQREPVSGVLAIDLEAPGAAPAFYATPAPVRSVSFDARALVATMNAAVTHFAIACDEAD